MTDVVVDLARHRRAKRVDKVQAEWSGIAEDLTVAQGMVIEATAATQELGKRGHNVLAELVTVQIALQRALSLVQEAL